MVKFGFIPVEDSRYYQEALSQVELAEKLGFESVWLEEHHGTSRHYHPSPLIYLAGFATRTERIRLGTDIAILPLYHPVRLAEDVAQLDVMSKGRVILGAAIGYREEEFAAFQTPLKGRGSQFEQMLELIVRLWTEDNLDFESDRYALKGFTLEPKPLQKPRPPIWLGGWGKLSVQRAAALGDAWLPGPTANLKKLKEARERYNAHLLEMGIDPRSCPRPLTRDVIIASKVEVAEEMAQRYLLAAYRDEYSTWSHPLIGTSDSTATDVLGELRKGRFIIGSPSGVVEQINYFKEQYGMDHLICRLHFPGMPPDKVLAAVRLIGKEVIPAFKNQEVWEEGLDPSLEFE